MLFGRPENLPERRLVPQLKTICERRKRNLTVEMRKLAQSLNARVRSAQPQAIALKEAAIKYGVSAGLLRKLILKGDLPGFKIGTRVIIKIVDLEAYMARCAISPQGDGR